jgi:flagellar motor component MotA
MLLPAAEAALELVPVLGLLAELAGVVLLLEHALAPSTMSPAIAAARAG